MRYFKTAIIAAAAVITGIWATGASAQSFGADQKTVQRFYPGTVATVISGKQALELKDQDYAGVHWNTVDFVFDATGHLDHLSMSTSSADYDAVLHLASLQLNPRDKRSGAMAASEPSGPDMEIRVCEDDAGQITMTFEPLSVLS